MKRVLPLFFALAASVAFSCSSEETNTDGSGGLGGGGASAVTTSKKVIGARGGELEIDGATLTFPPGALAENTEVQARLLSNSEVLALPSAPGTSAYRSTPVAFTPHGLTFSEPVEVSLDYSGSTTSSLAIGRLADEDDADWESGGDGSDFADGKATFTIDAFSIYAVFEDPDGDLEPTDAGTGGSLGTGGSSNSGGTSSTGGASASGGSQGGGGLGGGPSEDGGPYVSDSFEGYVRLVTGTDVTVTSETVTGSTMAPYCMAGSIPSTPIDGEVLMEFTVAELTAGSRETYTPMNDALLMSTQFNSFAFQVRYRIGDGTSEWCSSPYTWETAPASLSWDTFFDCNTAAPYQYEPLTWVGIEVAVTGAATPFDLCVTQAPFDFVFPS